MKLVADLHVHSRFSRATSKNLDFIALHRGALEKGIQLLGTGDFTHPGWMAEIESQLEEAEDGLFRLRPEFRRAAEQGLPKACGGDVRFVLQVEISNIYKKADRTRKNHNLVFVPSIEVGKRLTEKLAAIGNVKSDGRPILGLDARDLLEITLESDPLSFLIPAHVWTPWFSMLGSKSGFDSTKECFGDLSEHIFAAETGLSSDPAMNWRVSSLDHLTLVSNSDAHSAAKLGREANLLDIDWGFESLLNALRTREGFLGTLEFYPEEGKYHLDGHRKCDVRLTPEETAECGGICPVCKKPVTVGVMNRVDELADREDGIKPDSGRPFESIVPLSEVAGEVFGVGSQSKKARGLVERVLSQVGPELHVLRDAPLEDIEAAGGSPLKEAIRRVRQGELQIDSGFDGEFGTIRIFDPSERDHLLGQMAFFNSPLKKPVKREERPRREKRTPKKTPEDLFVFAQNETLKKQDKQKVLGDFVDDPLYGLDEDQKAAAMQTTGPLLVVAGPGTGKTRTLVARIAHQIKTGVVRPEEVLAISFTNQASLELQERLEQALPGESMDRPQVTTFHGFGLALLKEFGPTPLPHIANEEERLNIAVSIFDGELNKREVEELLCQISLAKQSKDCVQILAKDPVQFALYQRYQAALQGENWMDMDDMVLGAFTMLSEDPDMATYIAGRYRSVSVDEYQDVNDVQAALISLISPKGKTFMAIGDPDQSIYGFRGARPGHFQRFKEVYKDAVSVSLRTSYRLTDHIGAVAQAIVKPDAPLMVRKAGVKVELVECPTPASEAEQILVRLERIIGGTSFFAIDSGRGENPEQGEFGFGDVAILCRTKFQRREIIEALSRSGVPCMSVGEDEPHDVRAQKVAIMTMHASKGREFDVVFVAGVEPGLLPLDLNGLVSDLAEERRLLYVAVTRARALLVLSYSKRRMMFGQLLPGGPSEFVAELPGSAVTFTKPELPPKAPQTTQLPLF